MTACLLAAAPAPLSGASPQTRPEPRELRGVVVRGSGPAGVPGARVELHRVTADSGALVDSATAGADGRFSFRLAADPGAVWIAATRHDGVRYFGPPVHGDGSPPEPYRIAVYDTVAVAAPAALELALRHTILVPLGGPGGGVEVMEVFDVAGEPERTLVPVPAESALWSADLPGGARGARLLPAAGSGGEAVLADGRIRLAGSLPPGGRRVAVGYELPGDGELRLPVRHPTRRLELLVAAGPGVEARVEGLAPEAPAEVEGRRYVRFRGTDLAPGARVRVTWRRGRGVVPWLWLAGGAACLAGALVAWRLLPGGGGGPGGAASEARGSGLPGGAGAG